MLEVEEEAEFQVPKIFCVKCTEELETASRFCPSCGAFQKQESRDKLNLHFNRYIRLSAYFFGLELLILSVNYLLSLHFDFGDSLLVVIDGFFILNVVVFAVLLRKEILPLLRWPKWDYRFFLFLPLLAPISYLVAISTDSLNKEMGEWVYDLAYFGESPYWFFYSLILTVFVPAIFEELGYRGIIQTSLGEIMGKNAALIVAALAFFLVHFSMLSIYWLLPMAFVFGWLRMRYNSLYYGMIVHGLHNFLVLLIDTWEYSWLEPLY